MGCYNVVLLSSTSIVDLKPLASPDGAVQVVNMGDDDGVWMCTATTYTTFDS